MHSTPSCRRWRSLFSPGGGGRPPPRPPPPPPPPPPACHLARTVCRRAERRVWTLAGEEDINPEVTRYLNRLSDLLFVVARVIARHEQGEEVLWRKGYSQRDPEE
jgi:hypothetical protein